ncbi:MAG TPA: glutathione synthase [Polyangia bacterium]|jgi:glutathione synthase|nr:glutathione synthase [Polyangia bacterium]
MRVCFVVNNVKTQKATYTTLCLAFAGHRRGHDIAFVSVDAFSQGEGSEIIADVVRPKPGRFRDAASYARALTSPAALREEARLADFDVVFLRNNPNAGASDGDTFNPALDFGRRLKSQGVLVVNDPDGLSRAGSKMYLAGFPHELRPRTLITRSIERVRGFLRELDGPAIIKPLAGFGGQNVFYVARGQTANLPQMISTVRRDGYVIVQEFLPAVSKGDKRVLLLGGAPLRIGDTVAAYRRMRPRDDIRNNMHVGGSRRRAEFSEAEQRICELLRPRLTTDGLYLVGVDLVGDKILEINVFAPGGIHNINELYDVDVGTAIIRDLERKVELRAVYRDAIPSHVFMRT